MRISIALGVLLLATSTRAEVKSASSSGFIVEHVVPVKATAAKLFAALSQVAKWWDPEHTWSGSAANLSLKPEAGGCFCEKWKAGSAEHGRVVKVEKDKVLRLIAPLGPLQEMAVGTALTFELESAADGNATVTLTYRVSGDGDLDKLAPVVDGVLGTQVARLKRFVETGTPDAPRPSP